MVLNFTLKCLFHLKLFLLFTLSRQMLSVILLNTFFSLEKREKHLKKRKMGDVMPVKSIYAHQQKPHYFPEYLQ